MLDRDKTNCCFYAPSASQLSSASSCWHSLRPAMPDFFSVAMLCNFAVKHCNQGLAFTRRLDIGSAHDIGCGERLAVQAVVRVIV